MTHRIPCLVALIAWSTALPALGQAQNLPPDQWTLLTASTHPIKYYLSLPRNYRSDDDRRWPVLVCVEGAGCLFQELAQQFQKQRGDLPVLLVVPCTVSNTTVIAGAIREKYRKVYTDAVLDAIDVRGDWDEAGLRVIFQDLRERYRGADQVYMTGFSGGGIATYRMIGSHPELLAAAVPVCANYFGGLVGDDAAQSPAAARALPIHQIIGADDPFRFPWQNRWVLAPAQTLAILVGLGVALGYVVGKRAKRSWTGILTLAAVIALGTWFCLWWKYPGIEAQNDWATQHLQARGYTNITRTVIPGMGHDAAPELVFGVIRPLIGSP